MRKVVLEVQMKLIRLDEEGGIGGSNEAHVSIRKVEVKVQNQMFSLREFDLKQ